MIMWVRDPIRSFFAFLTICYIFVFFSFSSPAPRLLVRTYIHPPLYMCVCVFVCVIPCASCALCMRGIVYKGWFNSLAGVVKRRFASYVKLHLAAGGEGTSSGRERPRGSAGRDAVIKPHLRSASANAALPQYYNSDAAALNLGGAVGEAATLTAASKIHAPSPHVLSGGLDRRHRSPDPPPRLVGGQGYRAVVHSENT